LKVTANVNFSKNKVRSVVSNYFRCCWPMESVVWRFKIGLPYELCVLNSKWVNWSKTSP